MATQEVIYDAGIVQASPDVVELALVGKPNALALFEPNGLDPILEKIRAEVKAHVADISTERGRKAIASLARKVASSKVRLDDFGKELVVEVKAQIGAIDAERKRMRDELDKLRDETRQPLTEWENKETERLKSHEYGLAAIEALANVPFGAAVEDMQARLESLKAFANRDWQEFSRRYQVGNDAAVAQITRILAETVRRNEEQAELQRLQAAESKRLQEERDVRLQAEAAERARLQAEAKARADAEAEELRQYEAAAKAKQEAESRIQKVEQEAALAKAAAELAAKRLKEESERKAQAAAAEAKRQQEAADHARQEAEERTRKAEADTAQAIEHERQRVADEKRKEAEAVARREANRKHVNATNAAIVAELVAKGIPESWAEKAVSLVSKMEIANMRITY